MKNILYIFLLLGFTSCGDSFVDILPKGKIIPTDTDHLAMMLNLKNDINVGGGNYGKQADEIKIPESKVPTTSISGINSYTWQDFQFTDNESDADWDNYYKVISRANFVIQNIDGFEKGSIYDVDDTKGRALFIRANAFFYLVNAYGKHYDASTASTDLSVPLTLELDINASLPRSTVEVVYNQILADLTTALPLLPEMSDLKTHASKASVYALLGRVYLYQQKYDLAQQNSKKCLDIYSELDDYNALSLSDGINSINGIQGFISNDMAYPENIYIVTAPIRRTELFLANAFVDTFDKVNDLRYKYFMTGVDQNDVFLDGEHLVTNYGFAYWSGISTPEVILNYCEALMKIGTPNRTEAVTYLNLLRTNRYNSASYVAFPDVNDADVLNEVMLERKKELRTTAWSWFDMKRLGLTASRTVNGETFTITGSSNNYVWAIPLNVIALNPLLEQNDRGL